MPAATKFWKPGLQLCGFALAGAITGWLSGWIFVTWLRGGLVLEAGQWIPGTIFALLWIGVALSGSPLATREPNARSWKWIIGFLLGVTLSYTAAYHSAFRVVEFLTNEHKTDVTPVQLAVAGMAGGIPGGMGFACMLSLLFRAFDAWGVRLILTACSTILGSAIVIGFGFWDLDPEMEPDSASGESILWFFVIWQCGMAASVAAADTWWQRRARMV